MTAYEIIKEFYEEGTWDKQRVRNAVSKGKITPEQYEMIVHEPY